MLTASVDIVIVNFNSTDYILTCIDSIMRARGLVKVNIIIVDNHSVDRPERIQQAHPEANVILSPANLGFAKAVNLAMKRCKAEYVVLLNPDTIIFDGFFESILNYMAVHREVAIAGPRVLEKNGTIQGSARRFPSAATSFFGRKSPLTRLFPNNPFTKREFVCFNNNAREACEVDWVSGACMVARKSALEQVAGFDERFFLYWEDTDLCRRLKNAGWKIVYFPQAGILHHTAASSDKAPVASIIHFHKSCFLLYRKHVQNPLMKFVFPLVVIGLGGRCLLVIGIYLIRRLSYRKQCGQEAGVQARKRKK